MGALSIGCRHKHWSLIILSNFDSINWLSLNMPGHYGTGCSWVQSSLHHNGRAYWGITSWWNQNSIKWSVISVDFCSLCWVPPYQTSFLNFELGYLMYYICSLCRVNCDDDFLIPSMLSADPRENRSRPKLRSYDLPKIVGNFPQSILRWRPEVRWLQCSRAALHLIRNKMYTQ